MIYAAQIARLRPHVLPLLLLLLATFAVYGQVVGHDFILNWDDKLYVTDNEGLLSFSRENIRTIFSTYYVGNYAPVQMLSYMLDYSIWGLWPGGFLLTNLIIHTVNGLLLYMLFLRWHDDKLVALVAAALFLLHPVQVESVAWISQRKNLLAMFFFLLAWHQYCRYRAAETGTGHTAYVLSVFIFVLALLSKSAAVIFPLVIVLFDICFPVAERRMRLLDKIPYVVAAGCVAAVAMHSQQPDFGVWGQGGGRTAGYHGGSPLATFFTMLPVFCRYLAMLVWPGRLSAEYDTPVHGSLDPVVVSAALLLALLMYLSVRLFRANRRIWFWAAYFVAAFLPVSQIVPLVTLMNDRYLYFPMIGVAGVVGAGTLYLRGHVGAKRVMPLLGLALVLLAATSFHRVWFWRDEVTLWRDAVTKSPKKSITWERLGEAAHRRVPELGNEALYAYQQALKLDPASDLTRYNLGKLYADLGEIDKGFATFTELLQRNPDNVMGLAAIGDIHLYRGELAAAERSYKRALAIQPEAVQVLTSLGKLALMQGGLNTARDYFLQAEKQDGSDPFIALHMAGVEAMAGQAGESLLWLERALQRGFGDYDSLVTNDELAPIRADLRFTELMRRYFPKQGSGF